MTEPITGETIDLEAEQLCPEAQEAIDTLDAWCLIQDVNAAIERLPAARINGHERAIFERAIRLLAGGE